MNEMWIFVAFVILGSLVITWLYRKVLITEIEISKAKMEAKNLEAINAGLEARNEAEKKTSDERRAIILDLTKRINK